MLYSSEWRVESPRDVVPVEREREKERERERERGRENTVGVKTTQFYG